MGHNIPVVFRSGHRPFAHPLLPERRHDRQRLHALITHPSPLQNVCVPRKVTDTSQPARLPGDGHQHGGIWLWETTKGAAMALADLVRSSKLSWTGEKRAPAAEGLEPARLLDETSRRALEVPYHIRPSSIVLP